MQQGRIQDRACGKWTSILPVLGVPAAYLKNEHGPCPMCGGKDRFRYDDRKGTGSYYCNGCGAGDGVDLVMKANKIDFKEAVKRIEAELPNATVSIKKAAVEPDQGSLVRLWQSCHAITSSDPAGRYLKSRGLRFTVGYPVLLRYHPALRFTHEDKSVTKHPAMVAKFVGPHGDDFTLHMTYLDEAGHKAKLPDVRKLAPRKVPRGGAVRLTNSAETMGVAEGIETALSAMQLFDVPVWACLSSVFLANWVPPASAKNIIVFGDSDANHAGQAMAHGLANKLILQGFNCEVRLPDSLGEDWNDVLASDQRYVEAAQ